MAKTEPRVIVQRNEDDILFMMRADDFRLHDPRFAGAYTIVETIVRIEGALMAKQFATTESGYQFRVYPDWSVMAQ